MDKHSLRRCYVQVLLGKEVRKSRAFLESHHGLPRGWKSTNEVGSTVLYVEKPLSIFWLQKPSSLWRSAPPLLQVILKRWATLSFAMVMQLRLAQIYPPHWDQGLALEVVAWLISVHLGSSWGLAYNTAVRKELCFPSLSSISWDDGTLKLPQYT